MFAADIDKVLAIVNDDVITANEFGESMKRVVAEFRRRGGDIPPENLLEQEVLDRMILEKIQLQLAEARGIDISQAEIDASLATIAQSNGMSVAQLRGVMEQDGIDFSLMRQNIKEQMIIQRLIESQVTRRVVVTDEEVNSFLNSPLVRENRAQYDVSHILLNVSSGADQASVNSIRARAQEIRDKIVNGMDFSEAARVYSEAGDASNGGSLGWRTADQLPALFVTALDTIGSGEMTPVIQSPNGFHIIKLNDVRGQFETEVTQTQARHILIRTDEFTSSGEAEDRLLKIRERIVNGADFAELALAHSDDTVSSVRGGDLGWLSPGDTVRPFELAMEQLEIGAVSEPVLSPYGVHIIQVNDRRKAKPTETGRSNARRQLRVIKTEEKMQEWIDRIRDGAYIKIL